MTRSTYGRILLPLLLLAFTPFGAQGQERGKALYDLMNGQRLTATQGSFQINWLPDGSGYYVSEKDDAGKSQFYRVDPRSQKRTLLFDEPLQKSLQTAYANQTGTASEQLPFSRFNFVMDGTGITFETDGKLFLFDLQNKALRELNRPELEPRPSATSVIGTTHMRASQIWTGTYAPDYSKIAYVKGYDLYMMDTATGEEKALTQGGNELLMNGRADWVYPEELGQGTAFWWSPDGSKVAYLQFDETEVFRFPLVHDLTSEAALELEHYPKPGEPNPTVKLFVVDVATGKQVEMDTNSSSENYILKPQWLLDGSELTFQRMNRHQNQIELLAANPETGSVRTILVEKEDAFVLLHNDFILLEDQEHFLWSSERTGWRHLYLYDLTGNMVRQLTSGEWPVASITAVDQQEGWVYFPGYTEMGLETHFFRVGLDGTGLKKLTTAPGSHRVSMDPMAKFYSDLYSSFDTPITGNVHAGDGSRLHSLITTNTDKLDALNLEPPELVIVKAADGETDLHGLLFKPAGYDPNQSYPLLVSVYGGPYSKSVSNQYYMNGREQVFAQLGFMVWKMDNRGLTRRGKAFETKTYLKLGQIDLADQAAGVEQITQRPYVDGGRVGVFGGSYGGYMTAMALLQRPEVFHVGVAGAPVTDWRNYDTAYTERYMRTPQENTEGYDLGSAMTYADNLEGKLLLVHGTIDNNVHPGNTMQLINALVDADKRFDLMMYPEHRHGIRGKAGQHYRKLMLEYFLEHLDPPAYPWTR